MVLLKKLKIFHLFLLGGKTDQETKFEDIVERKQAFLDYKSKELIKQIENCFFFQKGQSMDLVQKLKIFHVFLFGKIGQENVFDDVLNRKKAFLRYNKKV